MRSTTMHEIRNVLRKQLNEYKGIGVQTLKKTLRIKNGRGRKSSIGTVVVEGVVELVEGVVAEE